MHAWYLSKHLICKMYVCATALSTYFVTIDTFYLWNSSHIFLNNQNFTARHLVIRQRLKLNECFKIDSQLIVQMSLDVRLFQSLFSNETIVITKGQFPLRKTFLRTGTDRKVSFVLEPLVPTENSQRQRITVLSVPVLRKVFLSGNQPLDTCKRQHLKTNTALKTLNREENEPNLLRLTSY